MTIATVDHLERQLREVVRRAELLPDQPDGLREQNAAAVEDPTKASVYRVVLLREGPGNPRDKHYYSAEAIEQAPEIFEGLQAFVDHPGEIEEQDRPERSVRDLVGWYTGVEAVKDRATGKMVLEANLTIPPSHHTRWVCDLFNGALAKKKADPQTTELVGLSINATGVTEEMQIDDEQWYRVTQFLEAKSVDVVTQAGAGGRIVALREAMRRRVGEMVREHKLNALDVKRAANSLRAMGDPANTPVIDSLEKIFQDLFHEEDTGGEAMAKVNAAVKERAVALEAELNKIAAQVEAERLKIREAAGEDPPEPDADDDKKKAEEAERQAAEHRAAQAREQGDGDLSSRMDDLEQKVDDLASKLGEAMEAWKSASEAIEVWAKEGRTAEHGHEHGLEHDKGGAPPDEDDAADAKEAAERAAAEARAAEHADGKNGDGDKAEEHTAAGEAYMGEHRETFPPARESAAARGAQAAIRVPKHIREATQVETLRRVRAEDKTKAQLEEENAVLRERLQRRAEKDEIAQVCTEFNLPIKTGEWLATQGLLGLTLADKRKFVEGFLAASESAHSARRRMPTREDGAQAPGGALVESAGEEDLTDALAGAVPVLNGRRKGG